MGLKSQDEHRLRQLFSIVLTTPICLQLPLPYLKVGYLTAPPAGNTIAPHSDWKRSQFVLNHEGLQQVQNHFFICLMVNIINEYTLRWAHSFRKSLFLCLEKKFLVSCKLWSSKSLRLALLTCGTCAAANLDLSLSINFHSRNEVLAIHFFMISLSSCKNISEFWNCVNFQFELI